MKINNLDQLEDLVLNPKIATYDKYFVFKNALKAYPIIFIDLVSDEGEAMNGIEDENNTLIPKMQRIISEIRNNPTAKSYSGMSVIRNAAQNEPGPEILIDFTN